MLQQSEIILALFGLAQAIFIAYIGWRQSADKSRSDTRTARISHQAAVVKAQTETLVSTLNLAQDRLDDALRHSNQQAEEIRNLRERVRALEKEHVSNIEKYDQLKRENEELRRQLAESRKREAALMKRIEKLERGDTGPLNKVS